MTQKAQATKLKVVLSSKLNVSYIKGFYEESEREPTEREKIYVSERV